MADAGEGGGLWGVGHLMCICDSLLTIDKNQPPYKTESTQTTFRTVHTSIRFCVMGR